MIKFDLTSAYYFLTYPAHTTYLGFAWPNDSGEMCYYKFLRHFFLTMVLVVPSLTKFLFKIVLK